MKNASKISAVILVVLSIFLIHSCVPEKPPTLSTTAVTAISYTTATSGGEATNDGGAAVTARGVCWNTSADPTVSNNKTSDGTGIGSFRSSLTGLIAGTTYYVRAFATNSAGTGYGSQITFTTSQIALATLTTTAITSITQTTATSGGNITADNGSPVTARGVCWGTVTNPTTTNNKTSDGTGTGIFVSNLINLQPGAVYYVRAYATNSAGTAYGNEISFTTLQPPTATTVAATSLASTTATLNGTVNANNQSTTVTFEYGTTTSYGQTINASPNTISGSSNTGVSANLIGLTANTTYHFRVKAVSSVGTTYGSDVSFTTLGGIIFNPNLTYGSVSDNDGNTYKTIQIGTQTWMAENLKVTKYNDGTVIPLVTDGAAWAALTTPAYCWVNNDAANKATYGALYNWFTVSTGKLCPTGWHVPSDAEWTTLTNYLGGESIAGGKLKETGITHWLSPNTGATNESGFTALPGCGRDSQGAFCSIGESDPWWSATENDAASAWLRRVGYSGNHVIRGYNGKKLGFSVRCVQGANALFVPTLTTIAISSITSSSATGGGTITSDGGASITAKGVCWSTSANPTIALSTKTSDVTGTSSFTSTITGLAANTTYYVRAYATNSAGTGYGSAISFTTQNISLNTFTDTRDGHVYKFVTIGTQTWMAENLAYLPSVSPNSADSYTVPFYYVHGYQGTSVSAAKATSNYITYGVLYNSAAANTAAPPGWHTPTEAEWNQLITYLGGTSLAGNKLKSTTGWPIGGNGDNSSGFNALPSGGKLEDGSFNHLGSLAYFWVYWTSTEYDNSFAWSWTIGNTPVVTHRIMLRQAGWSVRCIKN